MRAALQFLLLRGFPCVFAPSWLPPSLTPGFLIQRADERQRLGDGAHLDTAATARTVEFLQQHQVVEVV